MTQETEVPIAPEGAADGLRLRACQRTLEWVAANAEGWTSGQPLRGADILLLTIFARSTRTYEGVVRWLGNRAFGEQGLMLNRSLFEDMVDAHWVHMNEDLAVERLHQHDLHSRLLRAEMQRRLPDWFDGKPPPRIKISNEERKKLNGLFGPSGSRSWTGERGSLEDRLEGVIACWKTDQDKAQARFFAAWVLKLMNEVVHPSSFALGRLGAPTLSESDKFQFRFGSTKEWLTQSLHVALWTYHQIIGLVIERYAMDTAGEAAFDEFLRANRDFRQAALWERTGRMHPLPSEADPIPERQASGRA